MSIQKCNGEQDSKICSVRNKCYRYTKQDSTWQPYGPPDTDFTEKGCSSFMEVRNANK